MMDERDVSAACAAGRHDDCGGLEDESWVPPRRLCGCPCHDE